MLSGECITLLLFIVFIFKEEKNQTKHKTRLSISRVVVSQPKIEIEGSWFGDQHEQAEC